ncbi:hypothetical protein NERG_00152 [Nematocida ausubeli]|uniref:Uncharacterized protein n=1 Tax=Nematocida ausubeli (strain ATCC PRA-371 / ERTm2) TaxID=1913371 RepID=H8Z981_NEMA1|nr:hypothetical protein NERG_00152 [Nematocida ausubeli]
MTGVKTKSYDQAKDVSQTVTPPGLLENIVGIAASKNEANHSIFLSETAIIIYAVSVVLLLVGIAILVVVTRRNKNKKAAHTVEKSSPASPSGDDLVTFRITKPFELDLSSPIERTNVAEQEKPESIKNTSTNGGSATAFSFNMQEEIERPCKLYNVSNLRIVNNSNQSQVPEYAIANSASMLGFDGQDAILNKKFETTSTSTLEQPMLGFDGEDARLIKKFGPTNASTVEKPMLGFDGEDARLIKKFGPTNASTVEKPIPEISKVNSGLSVPSGTRVGTDSNELKYSEEYITLNASPTNVELYSDLTLEVSS